MNSTLYSVEIPKLEIQYDTVGKYMPDILYLNCKNDIQGFMRSVSDAYAVSPQMFKDRLKLNSYLQLTSLYGCSIYFHMAKRLKNEVHIDIQENVLNRIYLNYIFNNKQEKISVSDQLKLGLMNNSTYKRTDAVEYNLGKFDNIKEIAFVTTSDSDYYIKIAFQHDRW